MRNDGGCRSVLLVYMYVDQGKPLVVSIGDPRYHSFSMDTIFMLISLCISSPEVPLVAGAAFRILWSKNIHNSYNK